MIRTGRPLPQSPLLIIGRARCSLSRHGAGPHYELLTRLREHVLAEARAGHSLDAIDASLDGVVGLRHEDRAVLWLYGWASAAVLSSRD